MIVNLEITAGEVSQLSVAVQDAIKNLKEQRKILSEDWLKEATKLANSYNGQHELLNVLITEHTALLEKLDNAIENSLPEDN